MICTKLAQNIDNCSATPQRGWEEEAYIFDIEGMTLTKSGNIITNMAAVGSNKVYKVKINGLQPYTGTMIEGAQQLAAMLFNGTASLIVLGNGPTQATIINGLANGRYGIILKQKGVTDNSRFMVIGSEVGAKLATATFESYSEARGWTVTMTEELAINAATFLYKTNVTTTQSLIDSLLPA